MAGTDNMILTPYTGTHIGAILMHQERNQAWLARKMKVSEATVSRVLRGETGISRNFVDRACRVLGMPEAALFFVSGAMLPSMDKRTENMEREAVCAD